MRPAILTAALTICAQSILAAEPPKLPETINVAGAQCESVGHLIRRVPERLASLAGTYESQSITDGRQSLKLELHRDGSGGWLVDGTLKTDYGIDPPELVKFANARLQVTEKAAWFETGIPELVGHCVSYMPPRLDVKDPNFPWRPALVMSDSVYSRNAKAEAAANAAAKKLEAKK